MCWLHYLHMCKTSSTVNIISECIWGNAVVSVLFSVANLFVLVANCFIGWTKPRCCHSPTFDLLASRSSHTDVDRTKSTDLPHGITVAKPWFDDHRPGARVKQTVDYPISCIWSFLNTLSWPPPFFSHFLTILPSFFLIMYMLKQPPLSHNLCPCMTLGRIHLQRLWLLIEACTKINVFSVCRRHKTAHFKFYI